ncbi:MAG: DUF4838 domain-containing protein [Oscillospiraceae bacterium]|nr:DUF4838 domain-containing protein [Oscillospiraceae bacterium]
MNLEKPLTLAMNRKANGRIVTVEFSRAADILQAYLKKITGGDFPIQPHTDGNSDLILRRWEDAPHRDGFRYYLYDKDIIFEAPNTQAAVYAVYDFLERVCGCRYYTSTEEYIPFDGNLTVEFSRRECIPSFDYREVYYRDFFNKEFAEKHKMTAESARHSVWGTWCHSFQEFLDPDIYFDDHPEYYALYQGRRVGKNAQPCLSNPEVFEVMAANIEKAMAEKPECDFWSISQNDNDAYCTCDKCREIDEREGTPMGSVLHFVNRMARRFPDKTISTLAYWYTRKLPKTIRPEENVHIMLCNLEANRGLPIETDVQSIESKEELLAWEAICPHISLWDYCIQFRNLVSPFPNLRVIPKNIRFFLDHNVKMLFSQSNREYEGEFAALRGYLLAKCMWEPDIDPAAVIREFCEGYYGPAAQPILTYIEEVHDAMEAAGGALSIFGGPLDAKDSWMDEAHFNRYNALAEEALAAAASSNIHLHRVKTAVMPIWYAGIVLGYGDRQTRLERIGHFAAQARKVGLERVEEWTITPDMFITDALAALNKE